MTDVRQRAEPAGVEVRPSVVLHGTLTAVAAALSGLAVLAAIVLVAWVADAGPGSGGGDAIRAAADAWLLAHGGGLTIPAGHVRGIPLGLTLLAAIVLHRAGASLARAVAVADLREAGRATAALAIPYGLLAAAVARLAGTGSASASALAAGAGALLLAGLAGGRGVLRAADLFPAVRRRVPGWLPAVTRAALAAVAGLAAAGLAVLLVALVWHGGRFADLFGSLRPGLVGGVVLVLGCLLLTPNGALWAIAYAAGPGFSVGAGTGVSPFGATLGPVPAFPLLAALPGDGTPAPAVRALLLLPVLAGVLAGWELSRRLPAGTGPLRLPAALTNRRDDQETAVLTNRRDDQETAVLTNRRDDQETAVLTNRRDDQETAVLTNRRDDQETRAGLSGRAARSGSCGLIAGVAGGLVTAVLAALAGGSLGPGYLGAVGPSAWQVGLALAVEVGVPAALTAALLPGRASTPRTPGRAGATRAPVAPRPTPPTRAGATRAGATRAKDPAGRPAAPEPPAPAPAARAAPTDATPPGAADEPAGEPAEKGEPAGKDGPAEKDVPPDGG